MNTRFRDRLSLCSAIALGLGVSTGHPLGIIVAAGMPARVPHARNAQGCVQKRVWLLRCRPLADGPRLGSLHRAIHRLLSSLLRFGSSPQSCSRCPGRLRGHPIVCIAYGERRSRSWQPIVPPLGIIGLASPLTAAGYLFPGTGWAGLAAVALLPGIFLSTQALSFRRRCVVLSFVIGFCIGISHRRSFLPARAMPSLLADGLRSILISAMSPSLSGTSRRRSSSSRKRPSLRRASSSFRRPLSPGGPKQPRRSGANRSIAAERAAKYSPSEQDYRPRLRLPKDERERLSDLRSYDFGAAIDAL